MATERTIQLRVSSNHYRRSAVIFFPWYPAMMLAFEGSNVVDLGCGKLPVSGTKQPMKAD
jgi:hypothetical protein